ncbi:MAG: quinone oxidoreductase [Planctomycetota bacterium]
MLPGGPDAPGAADLRAGAHWALESAAPRGTLWPVPLAIRVHAYGKADQLRCDCIESPVPGPGEVLVRTTAIGVNFIDVYHRTGFYPLPDLPHGIGIEAAGVVEALGSGVGGHAIGDRVAWAGGRPGAYAEQVVVPADRLLPIPAGIDDEQAAAVLLKGLTAEFLLRRAFPVKAGMKVLVHAAAGGVGSLLCQWAREIGATVLGTVSTEKKAEQAEADGCTHAIVYTREDFATTVRHLTQGEGVDVVYDGVGKDTLARSLDCLRPRGMLVSFGNASGPPGPLDPLDLSRKGSLFLTRPSLSDYTRTRAGLLAAAEQVFGMLRRGALRPRIHERVPLLEARAAHEMLEARESLGSILLIP